MKKVIVLLLLWTCICSLASITDFRDLEYPDYFPQPVYDLKKSPLTEAKINLGRALFYDPVLSKDSTISCASCHSPYNAFAHTDHDLSHGINDQIGKRNAPALFNLAWQSLMMWDGATNHLDMQSLAPISDPTEMGEEIANVVRKLQQKAIYPPLFEQAFGDRLITGAAVLKALAQFQLTLVSANSKYDQVKKGEAEFTEQENRGYALFQNSCNSCHTEPLFSNYQFSSNGLPIDSTLNDYGRGSITLQSADSLHFKIPSLRNLSFTFPYMHDGRFRKLKEVLRHYAQIERHQTGLPPELKTMPQLSANEQTDLIAFLLTLNDPSFVFDPENKFPKEILLQAEGF